MTAKTDFQRWVELSETCDYGLKEDTEFIALSRSMPTKVNALVDACRYLQEHCFEYGFEKFEQALKELTGE